MDMWIVGIVRSGEWPAYAWEFMGVFDDRTKAIQACTLDYMFIMKASVNKRLPDETNLEPIEDCFYPLLQPEQI